MDDDRTPISSDLAVSPGSTKAHPSKQSSAPSASQSVKISSSPNQPHAPFSSSHQRKPKRDDRDLENDRPEDIRGSHTPDAPVQSQYVLRAIRDVNGTLTLDVQGNPLYSPDFLSSWQARASVIPTFPLGTDQSSISAPRAARLDGGHDQCNFLDFGLRKKLRRRQVPFDRSAHVFPAWDADSFEKGTLTGAFAESEPKKIDLRDKLYLAPLTTVGNLPFRRVCKRLGADVTCGEMALAGNLLQGHTSEWALLRRHQEEDLFGVQLAGSNIETVTRAAELVARECQVDFLELNAGCPIDIVFNRGGGCALMKRRAKFNRMVWSVSQVTNLPLGVKVRTGVSQSLRNAHEIIPEVVRAGASWVTVHGRSRKQRYSKQADWGYILDECAPAARKAGVPLLGNGDVYNWRDTMKYFCGGESEDAGITSVMVARGALIKPWLFTEIKEQRDWDIRSSERLDIYRQFAKFGLEHWGADSRGVEKTRKFLLEWLSFLYRYVPIGILEGGSDTVVTMGHRAPFFRGRDELETLLGSPQGKDWVTITEILLGKAPDDFSFKPKHKSNAWDGGGGGDETQG